MATDDTDIVSALRLALAEKVGRERFDLWFGAGTRFDLDDETFTLGLPSPFLLDWVRSNFRSEIECACVATLGKMPKLAFHVESTDQEPNGAKTSTPVNRAPETLASRQPQQKDAIPKTSASEGNNRSRRRRFANLESFIVGETNRLALAAAELAARRPGELSPLLLHGPTGVGKTHLLEGIWTATRKTRRGATVIYLSAEQFATGFLQALRGTGLPNFRQKYRGVDVLILDDLQFLCGKRYTQVELLYTIDTMIREGRQLVFAGDRPPNELCDLGPELTARLSGGMVCRIEPPDHVTRRGIVLKMASRLEITLPENVAEFIAKNMTQHAREISGALCRLKASSQSLRQPIDLELAETALEDLVRQSQRALRLKDIEQAVCETFGLEPKTLHSSGKAKRVSHPRMLAMWLARKYTRSALTEIGHYFGRRSHSTVVSARKRVDAWISSGEPMELADETLPIEEAIRQVEACLKVG